MHDMICGQPEYVAETLERLERADLDPILHPSGPLVVTGCGTSFHAASFGARVLQMALGSRRWVEAIQAYELLHAAQIEEDTTVLGVSHSGETPTTNRVLRRARRDGARIIGLCGLQGSSMERIVERTLVIGSTQDRSWANTMSYTTQLAAFAALAARAGGDAWTAGVRELEKLPSLLRGALRCEAAVRLLSKMVASRKRVSFLASGLDEITASEAALKIRETCSLPASGYHLEQFLHGPFLCLDREDAVVILRSRDDGLRAEAIATALARTGAKVVQVGDGPGVDLPLPRSHRLLRPIVSIVSLQFLAYWVALERRQNPDVMRTDVARYRPGVELLFR